MPRLYALIDCNSFYVSCERLFEPKLRDRAVVVLSNNDGCIVSRSKEAKRLPVAMGVPLYQVQHFVDAGQLVARSSNYTLYGDLSQPVMTTLASFGHPQEVYSIDECFLDLTADVAPEQTAIQMRSQVFHDVGIPTGVGLGQTKTLAKLASKLAKDQVNGVFVMPPPGPALAEVLKNIPVGDVWGIAHTQEFEIYYNSNRESTGFKQSSEMPSACRAMQIHPSLLTRFLVEWRWYF